jgi:hypothetical protein
MTLRHGCPYQLRPEFRTTANWSDVTNPCERNGAQGLVRVSLVVRLASDDSPVVSCRYRWFDSFGTATAVAHLTSGVPVSRLLRSV